MKGIRLKNIGFVTLVFVVLGSANSIAKDLTDCSVASFSSLFDTNETDNSIRKEAIRCHQITSDEFFAVMACTLGSSTAAKKGKFSSYRKTTLKMCKIASDSGDELSTEFYEILK